MKGKNTATTRVPPRSRGWQRPGNAAIGLVILVPVLALGCSSASVATTAPSSEAPLPSDTPVPSGIVLLTVSGEGDKVSESFGASGDSVVVTYRYDCSTPGTFALNFFGTNASPKLPDVITDEFGTTRSDTATENLNGATGPFHVEVTSQCAWSIEVVGAP